jgi:hypothetical protein
VPAALSDIAAALTLVLAAWLVSAVVAFGVFLATSYDSLEDVARAAFRAAVPAMWLAPAALLATSSSKIAITFGLLILANTVRLLFSVTAPNKVVAPGARRPVPKAMLLLEDAFAHETLPVIAGAVLLQVGITATLLGGAKTAAAAVAGSVAVFTLCAMRRGAARGVRNTHAKRTFASALLTLLLSTAIAATQFRSLPAETAAVVAAAPPKPAATKLVAPPRRFAGKHLVPGIILRPDRPPPKLPAVVLKPASRRGIWFAKPLTLPFTGDYHLFPTSSRHVQPDSTVLIGSPIDAVYVNVGGGPIETEALQPFDPPADLTHCGTIRLQLRSAELMPASATVYLITTTGAVKEVGTEIFAFPPKPTEVLEYSVPAEPGQLLVRAIRVVFHCNPLHRSQTTKAAVESFTFLPRLL